MIQSYNVILLPRAKKDELIAHCARKLEGRFLADEAREKKAYGLVGGQDNKEGLLVTWCVPLRNNHRKQDTYKEYMDTMMATYAIPSKTPFPDRGWVADPRELLNGVKEMHRAGQKFIGTYHMHIVAWKNDPLRDTPTRIDKVLAAGSGLITFIISMVDPATPIVRAFQEGDPDRELQINLIP